MAKLTKEQAQDLVNHFGGKRPAARVLGIDRSMINYWLNPEKECARRGERHKERYWSDVEYRKRHLSKNRESYKKRMANPEYRERKNAHTREYYANNSNIRLKQQIRKTLARSKKKVEKSEKQLKQLLEAKNA